MSNFELEQALVDRAQRLRGLKGYRVRVRPNREVEVALGTIVGVASDKRCWANLVRIKLDDGRVIHKMEGSDDFEVLPEKVEIAAGPGRAKSDPAAKLAALEAKLAKLEAIKAELEAQLA